MDRLESFLLPQTVNHQIDGNPRAPGLQASRRAVKVLLLHVVV